jgi:energy-coupling factor transporter ATP-binding protein EcfA2
LERGQCLLVVGPSGSGKSTLALAIAGLVPRELPGEWHGRLTVDGLVTTETAPSQLAARVGLVFQDPASQLVMDRVEDDVAFGLENRGWPSADMHARVPEALEEAGLGGLGRRRSTTLSGGEQQRLALAGVLAPRPSILVLDEPTANLDPAGARAFIERLERIRAMRAAPIVLVEHRAELAWPLADLVLALGHDGRPIDLGPPAAVLNRSAERLAREGIWLPDTGEAGRPGLVGPPGKVRVSAQDVSYAFVAGRPAVDGVSLSVSEGERVLIVGPNGSGKSTLGRLLVGLLKPDRGRIRLDGADPARLPATELARRAGFVFQDPEAQFLTTSVADEVSLGLRTDEQAHVDELMSALALRLDTFGGRSPYTLSGGEQRRLSLACVLVRRPRLLVMDEPTFGQDRNGYLGLLEILRDRVEQGTAVVAATHDMHLVRDLAGRVVALDRGRLARVDAAA